jgi:pyruvate dehydrogenase E2 component (dihydrolipoamide acetyltransferase)
MATVVIMPKQGQSVESCILTQIIKKKGDTVALGDILFTYETDKASFEEEAKVAGTVLEIFYDEGDEIPVLMNVMVIGNPGESVEVFRQAIVMSTSAVSPRAQILAEKHAIRASGLSGTGPQGRVIERDVQAFIDASPKATPLVKVMLKKDNLLMPETGSGLAGMVRGADVLSPSFPSIPLQSPSVEGQGGFRGRGGFGAEVVEGGGERSNSDSQIVPLTNIRKRIAKAMHASLQNSAQLTHHLGADARRILSLRKKVKEAVANGYPADITLNDMICSATILALRKFPQANAHFLGDCIRNFSKIHLGIAVDTARGLMVPALRNADELTLPELAERLKEVANACKKGAIDPDLLSSEAASFTVSNLGNYGVEMFTPIINLPQVAVLGVNTIVPRPKELSDGSYEYVPYLGLSLTYDHRALDGAEATRFLKQIAVEIENFNFELI